MPTKSIAHPGPHKYQLFRKSNFYSRKTDIFLKCILPDCPHFLRPPEMAIGRRTLCWQCNTDFVMNSRDIELKKPICDGCRERRKESRALLSSIQKGEMNRA